MGKLFANKQTSSSRQESYNKAYPLLTSTYTPVMEQGNTALNMIMALLGGNGDAAQRAGFDTYRNSTGYDFTMDQGRRAVEGSFAGRGVANSGATLKALTQFGQGNANQYFNQYLDRLMGVNQSGQTAAQIVSGAGNYALGTSQSTGKNKDGLLNALGTVGAAAAASDRRLKENITLLYELDDGLPVYSFSYIWAPDEQIIGVMADDVERLRPEAIGPTIHGYKTVYYNKIKELN